MDSLSDKLRALGVYQGTDHLTLKTKQVNSFPIEKVVQGIDHQTIFGTAFVISSNYGNDYIHGIQKFDRLPDLKWLAAWSGIDLSDRQRLSKTLFLDTETSGLAGGTGTFAFLVGLGYFSEQGFTLEQVFLRDPSQETAFLAALAELVNGFEIIVTFNGKSFDIPLLTSRHVLNRIISPFHMMEHIDMLHLARVIWKNRLPKRTLGELESNILRFSRSGDEIPGWLVPEIYFEYLKTLDARPLAGVIYHNAMDIVSLAALFVYTANLLNNPLDIPGNEILDKLAIARLYANLNNIPEALVLYENCISQEMPDTYFLKTIDHLAQVFKKLGNWTRAVSLWEKSAEFHQVDACIELAKFYEHQEKDYQRALHWAETGQEYFNKELMLSYKQETIKSDLVHRITRLKRYVNQ